MQFDGFVLDEMSYIHPNDAICIMGFMAFLVVLGTSESFSLHVSSRDKQSANGIIRNSVKDRGGESVVASTVQ